MQRLWVVLLLGLAACSSGGTETTAAAPATDLVIEFVPAEGAAPQRTTLTCEPAGGEHPDPEQACADLMRSADPFAPLPADVICTQVFGGPQRATVSGTYRSEPVRVELSRIDGCRIAQWDSLGAVLPPLA